MANAKESKTCAICGKSFPVRDLVPGVAVRDVIANEILRDHRKCYSSSAGDDELENLRIAPSARVKQL